MRYWKISLAYLASLGLLFTGSMQAARAVAAEPSALPDSSLQALQQVPDRRFSLEFRQVPVSNVFKIFSQLAQRSFRVDECAAGLQLDLKLQNAPLRMILDAVALQAGLAYQAEGEEIRVTCR